ncbi:MAG: hypothetical protein ACRDTK_01740 [Mycobacterium sp.]
MSKSSPQAARCTHAFARVLGPFVAIATVIVAIRLPDLDDLGNDLFSNAALPWILGAAMLIMGLVVIAFHQYWSGPTAVLISLFGWFVALRGLLMMAWPSLIQEGASNTVDNGSLLLGARIFFLLLTAMGLWLTYVGWVVRPPDEDAPATSTR